MTIPYPLITFNVIIGRLITAIDCVNGACPPPVAICTAARLHQYSPPVIPWILEDVARLSLHCSQYTLMIIRRPIFQSCARQQTTMAWSGADAFLVLAEQVAAF